MHRLFHLLAVATVLALSAACFALQYHGANIELMRRGGPGPTVVEIYEGKLSLAWEPHVPYRPGRAGQTNRHGFRYNVYSDGSWYVWGPLWVVGTLLAITVVPFAAAPWLHWRFSLRTLLIVATLVAVGLGLTIVAFR
jgi:hypothetical protein